MSERLDQIDQANEFAAGWTEANVSAIRSQVPSEKDIAEDEVVECESCCEEIDFRRARLGYTLCTDCARWQEEIDNRRRKTRWED